MLVTRARTSSFFRSWPVSLARLLSFSAMKMSPNFYMEDFYILRPDCTVRRVHSKFSQDFVKKFPRVVLHSSESRKSLAYMSEERFNTVKSHLHPVPHRWGSMGPTLARGRSGKQPHPGRAARPPARPCRCRSGGPSGNSSGRRTHKSARTSN